jgi:O-antigen ligase
MDYRTAALNTLGGVLFLAIVDNFGTLNPLPTADILAFISALFASIWVLHQSNYKATISKASSLFLAIGSIFVLYAWLRSIHLGFGSGTAVAFGYLKKMILAGFIVLLPRRVEDIRHLLKYIAWGAVVTTGIVFIGWITNTTRIFGTNANFLGFALTTGAVGTFALGTSISAKRYILLGYVVIIGVFLSESRSAMLALAVVIAGTFAASYVHSGWWSHWTKMQIITVVTAGATCVGVLTRFNQTVAFYFGQFLSVIKFALGFETQRVYSYTLNRRVEIYEAGFRMWSENPIFGHRLGTFHEWTANYSQLPQGYAPHSTYLSILSQLGVVGFVLLLVFLIGILRIATRSYIRTIMTDKKREVAIIGLGIVAIMINGIAVDVLRWQPTWILIGLVIAYHRVNVTKRAK